MLETHNEESLRFLRGNVGPRDNGPIIILIFVCALFCIIWAPILCRRRSSRFFWCFRSEEEEEQRHAEIIRISLENLRRVTGGVHDPTQMLPWDNPMSLMSAEDRKEFLNNMLVSRTILKVNSKEGPLSNDDDNDCLDVNSVTKSTTRRTTLLLCNTMDRKETMKVVSVEPCSICLNDYEEGDVLCWSQNSQCNHCFHKDCAIEWLMSHEECPLCRTNYLSLEGDEEDEVNSRQNRSTIQQDTTRERTGDSDALAFFQGMHIYQLFSHLQALSDARPNATIRLEGLELTDGRRGNLEIQHDEADSNENATEPRGEEDVSSPDDQIVSDIETANTAPSSTAATQEIDTSSQDDEII